MSLAELKEEVERQLAVPEHRFDRPRDVVKHIVENKPAKEEKVTVDLCVLSVEELELCWHISMIEKSGNDDFVERKALVEKLADQSKFVFCLTLWKARKRAHEHVTGDDYVPGHKYVVSGVSGLQLYQGTAQGSVQARFVVKHETDVDGADGARAKGKRKLKEPKP